MYIRQHFSDSFRKPQGEPADLQGCIERFLGDDILEHPLVRNLKLSDTEKNRLDTEISIDELDSALEGANPNSAAGIDGISTKFIKRYWQFFR